MKAFAGVVYSASTTLLLTVSPAIAAGPAQPLTSCNQFVETDVYLTGDLDCSGVGGSGVTLKKRATLDLRGFSIRNAEFSAVYCFKGCSVVGPGSLEGNGAGISAFYKLSVVDVDLIDNAELGIGAGRLTMTGSTVSGSETGILALLRATLRDSTVTGSLRNGIEVDPSVWAAGCENGKLTLSNSTVSGNALDPESEECLNRPCVDVYSCREPRLDETSSCGTSSQMGSHEPWGVCSLD